MDTKFVIAFSVVFGLFLLAFFLRNTDKKQDASKFTPNLSNCKKIVISGLALDEVKKVVTDFKESYSESLHKSFSFKASVFSNGVVQVLFPHDIEPTLFHFLINYLNYPGNMEVKGRQIAVIGAAKLDNFFKLPDPSLAGQDVITYLPANDQNFDEVYVEIGGKDVYVDSFSRSKWKPVSEARKPDAFELLKALLT